jgi:hypothetical protein
VGAAITNSLQLYFSERKKERKKLLLLCLGIKGQ